MTGYVVIHWHRAGCITTRHWTSGLVGCIMAEMLTGKTFFKGKDYLDQLTQFLKVTRGTRC